MKSSRLRILVLAVLAIALGLDPGRPAFACGPFAMAIPQNAIAQSGENTKANEFLFKEGDPGDAEAVVGEGARVRLACGPWRGTRRFRPAR